MGDRKVLCLAEPKSPQTGFLNITMISLYSDEHLWNVGNGICIMDMQLINLQQLPDTIK